MTKYLIAAMVACLLAVPASASTTVLTSESAFYDGRLGLQSYAFNVGTGSIHSYTQNGVTFAGSHQVGKTPAACDITTSCLAETDTFSVSYAGPVLGLTFFNQLGHSTTLNFVVNGQSGVLTIQGHQTGFVGFDSNGAIPLSATFASAEPSMNIEIRGFITGVPEPRTWALMIVGFGAAGVAMRRRKGVVRVRLA